MSSFAIYFIFTLDYGNDVRKKQIQDIFLFKFKMSNKAAEATYSINNAQELLTKLQCSGGARSFAKTMKALKTRSVVVAHWKYYQLNAKVILLQLQEKLPKNSMLTILWSFDI